MATRRLAGWVTIAAAGRTITATLTAADGIPPLDINGFEVFLANGYGNGARDGTITLTYGAVVADH
ncbi:MAG: hypothetical protein NTW21_09600 [Verrucomicrobia bacterium]|nr:hypothetical protein [Verrucomicrobiota bacterium]